MPQRPRITLAVHRPGTRTSAALITLALSLTGLVAAAGPGRADAQRATSAGIAGSDLVQAWGAAGRGEMGDLISPATQPNPGRVHLTGRVQQLSGGTDHAIALMTDGAVWTWGDNTEGELAADPIGTMVAAPIRVTGVKHVVQVVAAQRFSLALTADGTVWAWGDNSSQQLGVASPARRTRPAPLRIPGMTHVVQLSAADRHVLALSSDGTVWAWGENPVGMLGTGGTGTAPRRVPGLTKVVRVAAGAFHNLALRSNGTVWAWGDNADGQLGRGTQGEFNQAYPAAPVVKLAHVVQIAAGVASSYAVRADGTAFAWGYNAYGELGLGAFGGLHTSPAPVPGLSGVVQLTAGAAHVVALTRDGRVWTWGANDQGQLGAAAPGRSTAAPVSGVKGVVQVAAFWFGALSVSGPPMVRARAAVGGTARVGRTLSCRTDIIGAPTLRFAWLRNGTAISRATTVTYLTRAADLRHRLSCRATATNAWGSTTSTSQPVTIAKR